MERTKETLEARVRETPLVDRLKECQQRIGNMCAELRGPKMSIPVEYYDDDFYICTTLADAQATVEALQAIIMQMGEQAAVLAKDGMAAKGQVEALQAQLPAEMQGCTILFKECEKGHGRLVATNWRDHGCQTCEVEALQRERDEWRKSAEAHLEVDEIMARDHQAALDAEREKVKRLSTCGTDHSTPWWQVRCEDLEEQLSQLQALVRALEQPVYVCQGCGRLGRDGWLPTSFTSDELRGSVQCPDCGCIDREKNTARELAAICTKAQSELAQRTAEFQRHDGELQQICGQALGYPWFKDDQKNFPGATEKDGVCVGEHVGITIAQELANAYRKRTAELEALQRVRDEFERERDQLHAALMEAKAALDAEREKVKGLHEITKVICTHCCEPMEIPSKAVLQTQLTQLQALVRALPVVRIDLNGAYHDTLLAQPEDEAVKELLEYRATLDATTPAAKGGDGE